jgi:predicted O-methyltransferase YrrM
MNCVFTCVFNNEEYINIFYLFLESIFTYGNLNNDTDILVYTSTPFMNKIKDSHLYNEKIKFEINDEYNDIGKACKSRLDLFSFKNIDNYKKILYLDTDIIVKDDMNLLFDIPREDILYVVEEGTIDDSENGRFWGKDLFGEEITNYEDKKAFNSGVLLFNNCEKIKFLFEKIKEDMTTREDSFYDQPFIVYNAFKYNLYNNKILNKYSINVDINEEHDIFDDKILHHFCGAPGRHYKKIEGMKYFLNYFNDYTINNNIDNAKKYIDEYLMPIIKKSGELLEGNIFMFHHTFNYTDRFIYKAKNISKTVLNKNIKNVMEIGFNAGFSTLLMLLTNPNMNITCLDLGEHSYTLPCYEQLKTTFGDRINIIIGDSLNTMPTISNTYDLIHIDGGHSTEIASSDVINSYRLSKQGTILIMDDYDFPNLHELWDKYVEQYNLKPLDICLYNSPHHDIKYVIHP